MKRLLLLLLLVGSVAEAKPKGLHLWAFETVQKHFEGEEPFKACSKRARYSESKDEEHIPLGLAWSDYPSDVINACALLLHGTRY